MNQDDPTPEPTPPQPAQPAPAALGRRRSGVVIAISLGVGLVLASVAVIWAVFLREPNAVAEVAPPRDPRLAYTGSLRNVDPSVKYVADQRCAECHAEIAHAFAEHPMGRSLMPAQRAEFPPLDAQHHTPFEALGSRFSMERTGGGVRQQRVRLDAEGKIAASQTWEVHYVIGSGRRGFSYLTERDGCLLQTPISWYAQKRIWDLSPGFRSAQLPGRPVLPACLFCHANRANAVEGTANRYAEPIFDGHAIGCQRCHGPGALHVAERERQRPAERVDSTIVNPRHLDPFMRDGVCEQCHLVGEDMIARRGRDLYDFRPGLRPEQFWSVLARAVEPDETPKAVSHVEQMYQSKCHERGTGPDRLGCISCHDPHRIVPATERVDFYRQRCLTCHKQKGCTEKLELRQSSKDSCIDCHMRRYSSVDVPHTASTDHRILRLGTSAADKEARGGALGLPLASLYRGLKGVDAAEDERARSIALVKLALAGEAFPAPVLRQLLTPLETALLLDPADLPAAEARGFALSLQNRYAEALAVFKEVLAKAPDRERAIVGAAAMAATLEQREPALAYWRRAVAVNPSSPDYRRGLALLLIKTEAWAEAETQCAAWIRLDPFSTEARTNRVLCLLQTGAKAQARTEFARIEALAPSNLRELQIRFEKRLK